MKKNLTFVLYLNQNSSCLDLCLSQLAKLDPLETEIIIYFDSNSEDLKATIDNFFNKKRANFMLFKSSKKLEIGFCFNNAIHIASGKYIMFMNFDSIIDDNLYPEIKKILDKNYDIISFENTTPSVFYNLNHDEYNEICKDLILFLTDVHTIYNKVFNLEYLRNNQIIFADNKWYPELFELQALLSFKSWRHFTNQPLITFRNEPINDFNIYDLLFQIKKMDELVRLNELNDEFADEWEFWYACILKYRFLGKINEKYPLNKESKQLSFKSKEVQKLATQNVNKQIKIYCKNLMKNKYYKTFKGIIEKYSN